MTADGVLTAKKKQNVCLCVSITWHVFSKYNWYHYLIGVPFLWHFRNMLENNAMDLCFKSVMVENWRILTQPGDETKAGGQSNGHCHPSLLPSSI